jgi:hypothetical protein
MVWRVPKKPLRRGVALGAAFVTPVKAGGGSAPDASRARRRRTEIGDVISKIRAEVNPSSFLKTLFISIR